MAEVVDGSFDAPVIVDFWAPWCGPCKQLGPILEKTVRAANGAVRMVKLNIDENPEIAQQMRIQSIPAVYAFKDGRPVDGFVGALPESQVKQFVQRLGGGKGGPSPVEEALAMAKEALQAGDHASAGALFSQILQREPGNIEALAGLARAMIARGELAKARQLLDRVPKENAGHAEITAARAALELAEQAQKAMASAGKLRARLAQNPDDHEARFELATGALRQRRARSRDRRAADPVQARPRMERAGGAQAARQILRGDGADRPADPERPASAVLGDVFLRRMRMSERRGGAALPAILPIFPLTGVLLLPRGRLPLNIFEPRYLAMTRDALAGERLIGMVQPSDPRRCRQTIRRSIRPAAPAASPRFPRPRTGAF